MNQILLDNAYEAWATAIRFCDLLLEGKATLLNKKLFVSSLHNAVELFLKQIMLNENDHSVAEVRKPKNKEAERLLISYYQNENLNNFFLKLNSEEIMKFRTIDFNELRLSHNEKNYSADLNLLKNLRNNETHFYISESDFLSSEEFTQLHNFMIDFYDYLKYKCVIAPEKEHHKEYQRLMFDRTKLNEFSYAEKMYDSPLAQKLLNILDESEAYGDAETTFELAEAVIKKNKAIISEKIDEVWSALNVMIGCGMLECKDISEDDICYYKYYARKD